MADDDDDRRTDAFLALEGLAADVVVVLGQMIRGETPCSPAVRLEACQTVLRSIGILPVLGITMACGAAVGNDEDVTEDEDEFDGAIRRSAEDRL
jgi:hypothetical protein